MMKKKHVEIIKVNKRRVQVKNEQWITTVELTVNRKTFFREKQEKIMIDVIDDHSLKHQQIKIIDNNEKYDEKSIIEQLKEKGFEYDARKTIDEFHQLKTISFSRKNIVLSEDQSDIELRQLFPDRKEEIERMFDVEIGEEIILRVKYYQEKITQIHYYERTNVMKRVLNRYLPITDLFEFQSHLEEYIKKTTRIKSIVEVNQN
jgi:hypothetical protein